MSFTICWHHHVQRCAMFEHSHDLCSSIFYKYSMLDVGDICVAASLKERGRPAPRPQVLVHRHTHTHTQYTLSGFLTKQSTAPRAQTYARRQRNAEGPSRKERKSQRSFICMLYRFDYPKNDMFLSSFSISNRSHQWIMIGCC